MNSPDWKTAMYVEDQPSLRDQFAMAAMQGVLASNDYGAFRGGALIEGVALTSYRIADAMLTEREKSTNSATD